MAEPDHEETSAFGGHAWLVGPYSLLERNCLPSSELRSVALEMARMEGHWEFFQSSGLEGRQGASHREPLTEHGKSVLLDPLVGDRPDKRFDHEVLYMLDLLTGRNASDVLRNDEVQLDKDAVGVDRGMLAAAAPGREECLAGHAGIEVEADVGMNSEKPWIAEGWHHAKLRAHPHTYPCRT